jgi:hypothetical protein
VLVLPARHCALRLRVLVLVLGDGVAKVPLGCSRNALEAGDELKGILRPVEGSELICPERALV